VRNKFGDRVGWKLNRVFVVHAPVNPFFVINICEQMQNGPLNVLGRCMVLDSVGIGSAEFLVWNMKNERVIRPEPVVFENEVPRDRSKAVTREDNRFNFILRTHNRTAQYPL
jgi:hypothetical protein